MQPPTTAQLLSAWDRGTGQGPVRQALALLEAACPQESEEALAHLSIGARDDHLMALRDWAFGRSVSALASCPACGGRLEIAFDLEALRKEMNALPKERVSVRHGEYEVAFRHPQSRDLLAVAGLPVERARREIAESCVLEAWHAGSKTAVEGLPEDVMAAVEQGMADDDPRTVVQLDVACAHCGHEWQEGFDIAGYLWRELDVWAQHLLYEVHLLASAYGWTESEILALSPGRRRHYLELVSA